MLSQKFRRFYSHVLASLSAIGIVSIGSERDAAAAQQIGEPGETITTNYYNDLTLTAGYTDQLKCSVGSKAHVHAAFPSGSDRCIFVCERGYGIRIAGGNTTGAAMMCYMNGSSVGTMTSGIDGFAGTTSESQISAFRTCVNNLKGSFYTGVSGTNGDAASVEANNTVKSKYNWGDNPTYWYSGAAGQTTANWDCVPVPFTVSFDCGDGENGAGYTGAMQSTYGQSFTLPPSNACAKAGAIFSSWDS